MRGPYHSEPKVTSAAVFGIGLYLHGPINGGEGVTRVDHFGSAALKISVRVQRAFPLARCSSLNCRRNIPQVISK